MNEEQNGVDSTSTSKKGIILMILSAFCACFGQLLWKLGTNEGIVYICIGFLFYGLGAMLMIIAYRFGKLSTLQPIQSINYILSVILGFIVFSEAITLGKVIGVACILLGVFTIARGEEE